MASDVTTLLTHVLEALRLLGVDKLVLAIHDQSFPSDDDEEIGRGSPYSSGGRKFLEFIRSLGFNGIQFGPQGKTTQSNPSPYDGTLFSKNDLSISLKQLVEGDSDWQPLLDKALLDELVTTCPQAGGMTAYRHAWNAQRRALRAAYDSFKARQSEFVSLECGWERFREAQAERAGNWLVRDAVFEVLSNEYETDDWRLWSPIDQHLYVPSHDDEEQSLERIEDMRDTYADEIALYSFCQYVAHRQHRLLKEMANGIGLKLFGDLQIGYSQRDFWGLRQLFLNEYGVGAPPSRTNREGQPWAYPVLDPRKYGQLHSEPGAVLDLFGARIEKMLVDFDGIRLDHPHGLVDPWVYRTDAADPLLSVQSGARLFSSPNLSDHPLLAQFAIVSTEQLAGGDTARYADNWVKELNDEQVARYSILFDTIMSAMQRNGYTASDVVCEVLSTCPYPLRRVMERHSLGRFRVTQKSNPLDPSDGYRSENAKPADWIMVGSHDTEPVWKLAPQWKASGAVDARAQYLAERLQPNPAARAQFAAALAADPNKMCQAMFADLFASPARHVSVFFSDLLGMTEVYNECGTVNDTNWSLRVPHNYRELYAERAAQGTALNLPRSLALALRARHPEPDANTAALIQHLERS